MQENPVMQKEKDEKKITSSAAIFEKQLDMKSRIV